ncbi:hypothetical protein AKI39_17580 [Bordetella sp. H567]|uniref:hypothetical protein n=1 Tax=Bordetella sp. H567 TaxID=1697043 RepID=UPI00081C317A|nr:hypothetical protein [Bordetella sp. H567]AOB32141.1 hypothetical protein AKI39_17580 [Bordetella sp. H567]
MGTSNFSVAGPDAGCMAAAAAATAPATPSGPGLAEQLFGGAMADLIARVDGIGQSTTEVGKEAFDHFSRTPGAAVAVMPPLTMLPSIFQAVGKVIALPSAPVEHMLGKTLPVILKAQALPYTPLSEWRNLPKTMLEPLIRV